VIDIATEMNIDMIDEIKAAMAQLEYEGILERTGEMRWAEVSREWQPVYDLSELGRALCATGISIEEYRKRAS
jgi:hypothetical protein